MSAAMLVFNLFLVLLFLIVPGAALLAKYGCKKCHSPWVKKWEEINSPGRFELPKLYLYRVCRSCGAKECRIDEYDNLLMSGKPKIGDWQWME